MDYLFGDSAARYYLYFIITDRLNGVGWMVPGNSLIPWLAGSAQTEGQVVVYSCLIDSCQGIREFRREG